MNFMKQFSYTTSASYGDFWRKMHQFFFFYFFINTKFIQEIIWILCLQTPKGYVCSCKKTMITVVYSRQGLRAALTDTNK